MKNKSIILDLHAKLKNKETTPLEILNNSLAAYEKIKNCNSVVTNLTTDKQKIIKDLGEFDDKNLLYGVPYSVKDNVSYKNIKTTGGSQVLENYIGGYDATIAKILKNKRAMLLFKDSMDEFGLGGLGLSCFTGPVKNNFDNNRIVGGSSSGSSVNVSSNTVVFSLGTDTGDSVRRPAAWTGILGYKPSYGLISRYGVYPYCPSLDHVGIFAKYVTDVAIVAQNLIKYDEHDYTSCKKDVNVKLENLKHMKEIKFVVYKNLIKLLDTNHLSCFEKLLANLEKLGHKIVYVDMNMETFNLIDIVYKVLTYTEGSSCYGNISGITFGRNVAKENQGFEKTIIENRTKGFGDEIKRRMTIGKYFAEHKDRTEIIERARKLRAIYQKDEIEALKNGDCILMPTLANIAPKITDAKNPEPNFNNLLVISNFSGTPSITLPFASVENMPWSITVSTDVYDDMKMLNIAYTLEEAIGGSNE